MTSDSSSYFSLHVTGIPAVYTPEDLRRRAGQLVETIDELAQINARLSYSTLRYSFTHEVDRDSGTVKHVLLLDLAPKRTVQMQLFANAAEHQSAGAAMAADREILHEALRTLPQRCSRAQVQFAMHNASAVRNCAPGDLPPLDPDVRAFLNRGRTLLNGHFSGSPWQLSLENVGLEWDCTPIRMRARIYRKEHGYSVRPLDAGFTRMHGAQRLRMTFPASSDAVDRLDRATHTGRPQSLVVRLGRDPGNPAASHADLLSFEDGDGDADGHGNNTPVPVVSHLDPPILSMPDPAGLQRSWSSSGTWANSHGTYVRSDQT